jgi:ABC-type sugar transport system substrate-binding protein
MHQNPQAAGQHERLGQHLHGRLYGMARPCRSRRIGITQNNVGVDSYQTTYEKAFIAAAEANQRRVEAVVLDAGGDVARQIAQMEDLIQQEVDAIIIWPTNGEAVIPAVRKAQKAGHSGHRHQLQHRRAGL